MTSISTSSNLTQERTLQENSSTPEEKNFYLDNLDYETFIQLLPLVVFLIVLVVVGVFGNLIVFLVYFKQFKASATRVFVLAMAGCDFLTNVFTLLWLLQDMRYRHTSLDYVCKLKRVFGTSPVFMSYLILVCVALDRRRRICQVHARQLSARQATYLLIIPFILTVCVVCPFSFLYGARPLDTHFPGVTGTTCGFPDTEFGRKVKQGYGIAMGVVCSVGFVLLTSSYMQISYIIYKKRKNKIVRLNVSVASHVNKHENKRNWKNNDKIQRPFNKSTTAPGFETTYTLPERSTLKERSSFEMKTRDFVECPVNVDTCSSLCRPQHISDTDKICLEDKCHDEYDAKDVYIRPEKSRWHAKPNMKGPQGSSGGTLTTIPESSINRSITTSESLYTSLRRTSAVESCKAFLSKKTDQVRVKFTERSENLRLQNARWNQRRMALFSKTTLMMFVLSIATLVFYVPYIVLMLIERNYKSAHSSFLQLNMHFLVRCLPIVNSVLNPFIYSFCNLKFRQECRRFLTRASNTLYPQM